MSGCPGKIKYLPEEDIGEIITEGKRQSAAGIFSNAQVVRNQSGACQRGFVTGTADGVGKSLPLLILLIG